MEVIEQQIETPAEEPVESISLREEIENAQQEVRSRDDSGRFAKKESEPVEAKADLPEVGKVQEPKEEPEAKVERPSLAPNSFSSAAKAEWDKVPAAVAQEIARREADIHREFTKQDGERQFGKALKSVIDPYMPLISQAGGNPVQAIKNLMETARVLQTADPATKTQLIRQLCQAHNISTQDLAGEQQYVDPTVQNLQQRLQSFEEQQRQQQYQAQQHQQAELQNAIGTFAANPANVHFEQVKGHMAALLSAGLAQDLQDAYEQAVYARPDTRSTLLASQQQGAEEKRLADMKAKADAARRASGSLTGSPGVGTSSDPKAGQRTLAEELRAAMSQHRL